MAVSELESTQTQRRGRAERTYEGILDAAAAAFEQKGYLGASLSDILAESGVTKGALYFHFKSKEEIARVLIASQFSTLTLAGGEGSVRGVQSIIDATHAMGAALQSDVRVRAAIRLVIEQGTFAEPDPEPYLSWVAIARRLLAEAEANGDFVPGLNLDELAEFIIAAFTGLQLTSQVLTGRADLRERIIAMWRLLLPGIIVAERQGELRLEGSRTF